MIYPIITPKIRSLPLYVTGIGIKDFEENVNRRDGYKDYQISFIVQGEGVFICEDLKYELRKGTCFFFKKNIPHRYYSTDKAFINRWLCFNGDHIDGLTDLIDKNNHCVFNVSNYDSLLSTFDRLYNTIKRNEEFSQENASAILYQFIIETSKLKNKNCIFESKQNNLQAVLDYIEKNFDNDIALDQIADDVHMSKFALCRIFKEAYGITIFSYLIKYRIQQAKFLLVQNANMNIKEIALSVGFNDVSYFVAVFKKHENTTPLEFRKIWLYK